MKQCTTFAKAQAPSRVAQPAARHVAAAAFVGTPLVGGRQGLMGAPIAASKCHIASGRSTRGLKVFAVKDGAPLDRPLRVAVIGGGPSGACAAETLSKGGVEAFLIERKMDNCKVRTWGHLTTRGGDALLSIQYLLAPAQQRGPLVAVLRAGILCV
jgi:hypothetical protein